MNDDADAAAAQQGVMAAFDASAQPSGGEADWHHELIKIAAEHVRYPVDGVAQKKQREELSSTLCTWAQRIKRAADAARLRQQPASDIPAQTEGSETKFCWLIEIQSQGVPNWFIGQHMGPLPSGRAPIFPWSPDANDAIAAGCFWPTREAAEKARVTFSELPKTDYYLLKHATVTEHGFMPFARHPKPSIPARPCGGDGDEPTPTDLISKEQFLSSLRGAEPSGGEADA